MINTPKYLLIHGSDVSQDKIFDQLKSINNYHRDVRGFPQSVTGSFTGYHYLITGGKLYKCKEEYEVGAHNNFQVNDLSMNYQSIGVCIGGDFDIELPFKAHLDLFKSLIDDLMRRHGIPLDKVVFHRDFDNQGKTCPGTLFTKEYLLGIIKPVEKPIVEKCNNEKAIIEIQKGQLNILQVFIKNLFKIK